MKGTRDQSNSYLVQGSILAAASIIVRIIGLMYRIPMNNILGNEGIGYYQFAFEIYHLALILSSYSLPLAVSKLVASRQINKEYRNSYRIFLCAMVFAAVIGLVTSSIIFFGAESIATLSSKDVYVKYPLQVLAPTIFVFSIMGIFRGFFQGKNTMIPTSVSQIIEQIVNAIVSIVAPYLIMKSFSSHDAIAAFGAAGGTLGTLAGALIGLLFLIMVFLVYKPVLKKQIRKDRTEHLESYFSILKLLIITISPILLSQIVYHISGFIDQSLFARIMATKEVTSFDMSVIKNPIKGQLYTKEIRMSLIGIYGNQYRLLTNVPVAIASAFGAAIVPSIATAFLQGHNDIIKNRTHWSIKINMIIAIPSAVGLAVLAAPIIKLLFPHGNEGSLQLAANFFRLGSIAIVFYCLSTITNAILQGVNRLRIPVIHGAISLGIHIVIVFLLLKFTNLSTYALIIGNVTFPMVICILNWIALGQFLDYQQEIIKTFLIPAASAGAMGVLTYFAYQGFYYVTNSNGIATIISIFHAIMLYGMFLLLFGAITEDEMKHLPKGVLIVKVLKRMHLMK